MNAIFHLGDEWKQSSFFLGTSPELEMALYTLCFAAGEKRNGNKIVCRMHTPAPDCANVSDEYYKRTLKILAD